MTVRSETVSVPMQELYECLSKMRETYCLRIGPATIEISGSERTIKLSAYGNSIKVPIVEGNKQSITLDQVRLVVEADRVKDCSNFTLTWDDRFEEKGQVATSYISTATPTFTKGTTTNLLCDNRAFTNDAWGKVREDTERARGVKHWPEALSQEQMNAITSAGRDKRLLLC